MLHLKQITKVYKTAGGGVHALRGIDLRFRKNEFVSILGASGCGKTTLLNIIGGLDHYTDGELIINGVSTKDYKDRDWDIYRNHRIGFVFQSYNLIPHQTVLGNVELSLTIAGVSKSERRRRAKEALIKVGLKEELNKRPNQLSGGQMQRVAIARALVNNPEILLADEPTGALDTTTSVQIMELIREIAGERLVIMVTHNPEIAEAYSSRIVKLQDGLVVSDNNPYDGEETEEKRRKEREMLDTMSEEVYEKLPKKVCLEVTCPHCKAKVTTGKDGQINEGVHTCLYCGKSFEVKKKRRWVQPPEVKTEKAEEPISQKAKRVKKENASMSFKTSLGLSARNLLTKKGRTAVTSIAGSIGIISVCLVLALSNGFNKYILKTEEDMLSANPIQITETTMDITAIMSGMQSLENMPQLDKIGDQVYVNSFLTNMAQGMTVTNDLSDEYLAYLESMDTAYYDAIVYDTGVKFDNNLFTEVEVEIDGVKKTQTMSLSSLKAFYTKKLTEQEEKYAQLAPLVEYLGPIYGKLPGTSDLTAENYGNYVLSQYDLIGENSRFPEKSNEAVLVIGSHNDVTDLTLAQLGFMSEKEFLSLFPQEGEDPDTKNYDTFIDFDNVLGKKFMLNYNDAVYTQTGGYTAEYLYDYTGIRNDLAVGDGVEVSIVGVLRVKEGMTYGCLKSGLYFTEKLYEEYQAANMNSQIAQTIKKQAEVVSALTQLTNDLKELTEGSTEYQAKQQEIGTYLMSNFQYFKRAAQNLEKYYIASEENGMKAYFLYGDTALRFVGGKDTVNAISIYTGSFETKEGLLRYLDDWNDTHPRAERVRYVDAVGTMMGMVETMLDAITYVLVAFTAISLIVSSVMIGIITYVSVVERTKEIGVLRSLGARKRDIKNLFNAETFIIGLTSGLFGVAVTYLLSAGVNAILGLFTGIYTLASLPISSAAIMVFVSVTLTMISGLIPARAAAKKDPVIALRTE
jgi:putative ABC transport system permease protein